MTKRLMILVAVLAAVAVAATGCGSSSGKGSGDALSFLPKDSPVVVSIQTDPEGDQYKQLNALFGKFPFGGQIKERLKQGISQQGYDYDKDIKPVLGNDFVVAIPSVAALQQSNTPAVGALKVGDEGKAKELIKKDSKKAGTAGGEDVYQSGNSFITLNDGVLVVADSSADLQAAVKRHDDDQGLTEDDLKSRMAGLSNDGIVKVGVNLQQLIAQDPKTARARQVKFVAGLRDLGVVLSAQNDGVQGNFKVTTEGLSEQDLPFATGSQAASVVRRATDVGFGMRNLAQTFHFGEATAQATDPAGYARYKKRKAKLGKVLGIDIDKDVIDQFEGDASLSVGLDGGFAVRSTLKDPAAFQATLKKVGPRLAKGVKGEHVGVVVPKKPGGFYAVATASGKKYVFGVIGGKFVLATDAARAGQFAAQSATPVQGASGSVVVAMDSRSVVNQAARQRGQGAVSVFTGALGDFVGSIDTETDGMTGQFKQAVK